MPDEETVERTKDHFKADEQERDGFAWPCCVCVHREEPLTTAPCKRCDHYAN